MTMMHVWSFWLKEHSGETPGTNKVRIGFRWDLAVAGWERQGLPGLSNLAGPIQHFKAAILSAWWDKVSADLRAWNGFRRGPLLDFRGSHPLLSSSHVREK